ncbi:hypothetical protein HK102_008122, partial [Quaeritorhiza haematococci]
HIVSNAPQLIPPVTTYSSKQALTPKLPQIQQILSAAVGPLVNLILTYESRVGRIIFDAVVANVQTHIPPIAQTVPLRLSKLLVPSSSQTTTGGTHGRSERDQLKDVVVSGLRGLVVDVVREVEMEARKGLFVRPDTPPDDEALLENLRRVREEVREEVREGFVDMLEDERVWDFVAKS